MFTTRFKQLKLFLLKALSSKSSRLPILFVHMPKAAGTSFRTAALESRRIKSVLCDYDEKKPPPPSSAAAAHTAADEKR